MAVPKELNFPVEEEDEEEEAEWSSSDQDGPPSVTPEIQSRRKICPMQFFTGTTSLDEEISRFNGQEEDEDQQNINAVQRVMPSPSSSLLSLEALRLLRNASRSVMKKKNKRVRRMEIVRGTSTRSLKRFPISTAAKTNTERAAAAITGIRAAAEAKDWEPDRVDDGGGGDGAGSAHSTDHLLLLRQELDYLRSLLPSQYVNSSSSHGDLDSEPCVVKDALSYLKSLKEELRGIKEGLKKPKASTAEVEVNSLVGGPKLEVNLLAGSKIEVKVSCQKRPGILGDIMVVLESFGLVFDKLDASCHHHFLLQATSSQEGVHLLDKQAMRKALWVAMWRK